MALDRIQYRFRKAISIAPNFLANLRYNLGLRLGRRSLKEPPCERAIIYIPYLLDHQGAKETFLLQIIRVLRHLGYTPEFAVRSMADLRIITASIGMHGDYRSIGFRLQSLPRTASELTLVCDDLAPKELLAHPWKQVLMFHFDLSKPYASIPNPLFVPFPDRSIGYLLHGVQASRSQTRVMRCFFSGSWRGYKGGEIGKALGKMERADIVEAYKCFPGTYVIRSERELLDVLSGKALSPIGFYLVDTDYYRILQAQWFHVLGQAETFLAPPGVRHPLSHNIVEAMAVGTIPVTNYPEWFHPPLEEDVHCFTFRSRDDLLKRLTLIRDMPSKRLEEMRQAVLAYYDEYLDPARFVQKLQKHLDSGSRIVHLVMVVGITDFFPWLCNDSVAYGRQG